jgi:hypothetical protein
MTGPLNSLVSPRGHEPSLSMWILGGGVSEELTSNRVGRVQSTREASQGLVGDPRTKRWIEKAMALACATGGSMLLPEELAVVLGSLGYLKALGISTPRPSPAWFILLSKCYDEMDDCDLESTTRRSIPFARSLPWEFVRSVQRAAPLEECFQALMKSGDEIFLQLFGSAWSRLKDSPQMRLRQAHVHASAVQRELRQALVGQSEVIEVLRRMAFELELRRGSKLSPATALFLGPPGCGKSLAARLFGKALVGCASADKNAPVSLMEVEMTQYTQWSSDLLGSAHRKGSIAAFVAKHPNAIIICHEFEKAHRKALESLLPALDQGFLPEHGENPVNFREALFVFTSNLGSEYWGRPASPEEGAFEVDPLELLSLAETPDDRTEWYKTPIPKELLSRLGKGPVVLFRRHVGHHFLEKVDRSYRSIPEVE